MLEKSARNIDSKANGTRYRNSTSNRLDQTWTQHGGRIAETTGNTTKMHRESSSRQIQRRKTKARNKEKEKVVLQGHDIHHKAQWESPI